MKFYITSDMIKPDEEALSVIIEILEKYGKHKKG